VRAHRYPNKRWDSPRDKTMHSAENVLRLDIFLKKPGLQLEVQGGEPG